MMRRTVRASAVLLVVIAILLAPGSSQVASGQPATPTPGQRGSVTGVLSIQWGDGVPNRRLAMQTATLRDDTGGTVALIVDEAVAQAAGGVVNLDRRRVSASGTWASGIPGRGVGLRVDEIRPAGRPSAPAGGGPAPTAGAAVSGPKPWVTILCRFADSAEYTPAGRDPQFFNDFMGIGSPSPVYPSLDHYWRQSSHDQINLVGSQVAGWYTLPRERAYYLPGGNLDFGRAAEDCTAVAEAAVHFPSFVGINLMFNRGLDCCAWGGSWTLTRDGVTRTWSMTWMPESVLGEHDYLAHEMGHGFGFPHSSGSYRETYDSDWDVMSGGGICPHLAPKDSRFGCISVGTIGYHRWRYVGWIADGQTYVAAPGSDTEITLVTLDHAGTPGPGQYRLAVIPIRGSSTQFYTVEARRKLGSFFEGYDGQVPGTAIVIHRVDTTRSDRNAQVEDADRNGNPNDAGAMWTANERFASQKDGVTVTINPSDGTKVRIALSGSSRR